MSSYDLAGTNGLSQCRAAPRPRKAGARICMDKCLSRIYLGTEIGH
jgi:hypothetical protein